MGAFHGWGLGTGARRSVRKERDVRRALSLVVVASRDVGKPTAEREMSKSPRRAKRPRD